VGDSNSCVRHKPVCAQQKLHRRCLDVDADRETGHGNPLPVRLGATVGSCGNWTPAWRVDG
jgi:hypothetical protein